MTIPLLCVGLAFLLIYLGKLPVSVAMAKEGNGKYDNNHPRDQQARLTGWGRRALAAHLNGFEGFMGFAAAVLVAHVAQADAWWSMVLAVTYVVSRVAYLGFYLANIGAVRSTVWFVGFLSIMGLFFLPYWG